MPTFTVTLSPGETIVLPADAIITGVFADGDASVTSSCSGTLPESSDYVCGAFYFNIDDDDNDNHPNDETSTYYRTLKLGDLEYELDGRLNDINDPDFLNAYVPDQGLFTFTAINRFTIDDSGTNKRKAVYLYFKVAEPFWAKASLMITSHVGNLRPSDQWYLPHNMQQITCNTFPF